MKPRIIAFYLPQFHPFKENDEWWGKGFTEWTNVGKAKPLFWKHDQPKIPTELGYYDLRVLDIRKQQVTLAKEAGIYGFCYWHYWFGDGKQLLNEIIDEVVDSGEPDFPFCVGWANEPWKAKQWNKDGKGDRVLIDQKYSIDDYRSQYEYVSNLFKDNRYIKVGGRPFFLIYKPQNIPNVEIFIGLWNKWIKEDKIADSVYFVANLDDESDADLYIKKGFNAVTPAHLQRTDYINSGTNAFKKILVRLLRRVFRLPLILSYAKIVKVIYKPEIDGKENVIPFLIPNWDHTPRSKNRGLVFFNSTPQLFKEQAISLFKIIRRKSNNLVLLKSWNEWGEGNYMEPDNKWGKGYIEALSEAISSFDE